MASSRPLAAVMVGDATPLTVANLQRLASWCDLVLTEATVTLQGRPRIPLRTGWRELLGLAPPELRIFTTDLPDGASGARLEAIQRNGVLPALLREPPDRPVLLADSDELLDPSLVLQRIAEGFETPERLGLVPLYGAIDRVALGIHCCWKPQWAALRQGPPELPFLFPGPALATVAMVRERAPDQVRRASPLLNRGRSFGMHATMATSIDEVVRKLSASKHVWVARIRDPLHLSTMLSAGVHHAGWWIASHREPEPWLAELAARCGLRQAGPPHPRVQLEALRAWAEERLNPSLPDAMVRDIDAYVSRRDAEQEDFLTPLHDWQCNQPMKNWCYATESRSVNLNSAELAMLR